MIQNLTELNASLHQLSSFVDSLQALQLDCARKGDFRLFPVISEGYITRIQELNSEIREYLNAHPEQSAAAAAAR